MHNVYQYVHILSGILFYLSSAVNPIIYSLLSTRFRECFRELVCSHMDDSNSVRDSPPFPKTLLDPSMAGPRTQALMKDSGSIVPLLSSKGTLSMDSAVLTCMCKEAPCNTSVF
ncbi:hypothetical protein OJAV_G00038990 [Oryzias javanicus]|uniref:G-protein coupled receptors family 1 profile domain-containing protein n=1 Tax=Oryzias javanicus TaxID=123683 RepID=A0A3S2PPK6_ORYJA|nr:hypothetical protein OJAV_G00038990 [Oryzias javanicus]